VFKSSSSVAFEEFEERKKTPAKGLRFGVDFLDDALNGILPDDLILLGAPSGAGKTQLCCNIALANLEDGKRVHYIPLEAGKFEIERRLKFPLVFERYMADPNRPQLPKRLTFSTWLSGAFVKELEPYEIAAAEFFEKGYRDLFTCYKQKRFGLSELLQSVALCADETDLILIDHVHYFDFDDDNENRAIKEIAKTVRSLALEEQKPIVLVAHLRKRDRSNEDLVAGLDEFHGSSDLYKIATKVVTISPGRMTQDGLFETFFRTPKNRFEGGATRFIAREFFSPKKGAYEQNKYQLGWADQKRSKGFEPLDRSVYPEWSRLRSGGDHQVFASKPRDAQRKVGQGFIQGISEND
jgi:archaellum biogenesis ATPase FlaH